MVEEALLITGVFLAGIAGVLRAWAILYVAGYKNDRLITEGPFSVCRNPIYVSTLIGAMGIALSTQTVTFSSIVGGALLAYLLVQIGGEERKLFAVHGDRFHAYCAATPRLIPDFSKLDEPYGYMVRPEKFRQWMQDALWFVWGIGIVEAIETLHEAHLLPVLWRFY